MDNKTLTITITGEGYAITEKITKTQLGPILSMITSDDPFIQSPIPSSNSVKHAAKRRVKTLVAPSVTVRAEIENLELDPISDTYGNYWTIKVKSDRFMWILAVLNEKGFQDVNHKEISAIAERFGDNIPAKFVTSFLISHKKNGRAIPSSIGAVRTVRILKPGLDYVKGLFKSKV